jgi:hypothetical protein
MQNEKWFDIPNWEGFYVINETFDKVRSVDRMVGAKNGGSRLAKAKQMRIGLNRATLSDKLQGSYKNNTSLIYA